MDRTLSVATTPGQSGPRNNDNEGVLHIPKGSKIRLFSVISRILVGKGTYAHCIDTVDWAQPYYLSCQRDYKYSKIDWF